MDTLSYLIENTNQVKVDEKLVKEYERQNQTQMNRRIIIKKSNQKADKSDKPPSPTPRTRPLKGLARLSPPNNGSSNPSPKLVRPTPRPKNSLRQTSPQLFSSMSQKQMLAVLTTRIQSLRQSQRDAETKYNDSIQQLRSELMRCNQEYDMQKQEFDRIKTDISTTKKDIASLIHMVQKKGMSDEDHIRSTEKDAGSRGTYQKPHSPGSPRSVLSNFIKIVPAARQ